MISEAKKVKLTIDGNEVTVDESLTILEAAKLNAIDIPTLCHHPALSNWGGCRLCVVEVDKSPKLVASCVMPVRAGMEVVTQNAAITASRCLTLEFLFAERNHNCMICPDSGECELQKMAYAFGMDHLTVSQSFKAFPTDVTSEYMTLDHNRCILCGRCVRACQEIAGSHVLGFHNRGPRTLIGFDLLESRKDSSCINCGACLQVCPTGAISSRYRTHYAVKGQPAERRITDSFCIACGLLCPTRTITRDNQIIRVEGVLGRTDGRPDRGQLCYKGRFEVLKSHGRRLTAPLIKDVQGQWRTGAWDQALDMVTTRLDEVGKRDGAGALFGMVSSGMSNEVLALFKALMADRWGTARVDTLDGDHFRRLSAALDGSLPGELKEVSWKHIVGADMVLMVGADPQTSHPMLVSMLRQAYLERKLPIAVIGQARDAHLFSSHILTASEKELPSVLSMLCMLLDGTPCMTVKGNHFLGEEQRAVLGQIVQICVAAKSLLIITGEGITAAKAAGALAELVKLVRIKASPVSDISFAVLKPAVNSAAAWRLGIASAQARNDYAGAGLLLLGDEQGDTAIGWLKSGTAPEFLAAITSYDDPRLAPAAHVLLPKPLWLEEDGSYTSSDGTETFYKPKVIDPPAGVLRTWEILQQLSTRKGGPAELKNWAGIRADTDRLLEALQRY
jgi:NADH dehydrogenase/NADH:ubiquinone oxidoreductase subunit G